MKSIVYDDCVNAGLRWWGVETLENRVRDTDEQISNHQGWRVGEYVE